MIIAVKYSFITKLKSFTLRIVLIAVKPLISIKNKGVRGEVWMILDVEEAVGEREGEGVERLWRREVGRCEAKEDIRSAVVEDMVRGRLLGRGF